MKNEIRSNYIKSLLDEKEILQEKLEETTANSIKEILGNTVNEQLNNIISEADKDSYDVEEIDSPEDSDATDDDNNSEEKDDKFNSENNQNDDKEKETLTNSEENNSEINIDGDNVNGSLKNDSSDKEDADNSEIWKDLEQYKDADGEYDLTGMDSDSVIKVLKVMKPEDGVRVVKNHDGTITLNDDETDKEYIIDLDDVCESIGYTDDYQHYSAMEISSNDETADDKNTYSMDGGVPTGVEKPYGGSVNNKEPYTIDIKNHNHRTDINNSQLNDTNDENIYSMDDGVPADAIPNNKEIDINTPYDDELTESENCKNRECDYDIDLDDDLYDYDVDEPDTNECGTNECGTNECGTNECDYTNEENEYEIDLDNADEVEEGTNVGGFVQQNSTSKSHIPTSNGRRARNKSQGGEYTGTQIPRYSNEDIHRIMKKANRIFAENKQLKAIIPDLKAKIQESILINYSIGRAVKLMVENCTTLEEKREIVKKLSTAKNINESNEIYEQLNNALKSSNKMDSINKISNPQLAESRVNIVETPIYQSDDLTEALSLISRLDNVYKKDK